MGDNEASCRKWNSRRFDDDAGKLLRILIEIENWLEVGFELRSTSQSLILSQPADQWVRPGENSVGNGWFGQPWWIQFP
jgi:hypothetical protein